MSDTLRLRATLLALRLAAATALASGALALIRRAGQGGFQGGFQGGGVDAALSGLLGGAELLVILAFALGAVKTLSYAAALAIHALPTIGGLWRLGAPAAEAELFSALPLLTALVALFLFRREDRLLSLG